MFIAHCNAIISMMLYSKISTMTEISTTTDASKLDPRSCRVAGSVDEFIITQILAQNKNVNVKNAMVA